MGSTLQTFEFALKTRYTQGFVNDLTGEDAPFWARLKKEEDFDGEGEKIPLIYGRPQGLAGSNLAKAQQRATNIKGKSFFLEAGDYFGSIDIGDKVMMASRSNPGAFLRNKVTEIDGLHMQARDDLCGILTNTAGGWFARVAAVNAPGGGDPDEITVDDPSQVQSLEEGAFIVFSNDTGDDVTDTMLDSGQALEVLQVDRTNGVIYVVAGGIASVTGLGVGDYIFRDGNFKGDTSTFISYGLKDYVWVDDNPPDLAGMVRTTDPTRLAGCRLRSTEYSGLSIEERLQLLGTHMISRYKGPGPTDVFMNPEDWLALSVSLQTKGIRPLKDESTSFGFLYLEGAIGGKMVKIWADRFFSVGEAMALKFDTWTLKSMGPAIHALEGDNNQVLRKTTTNDYEYRLVSYLNLANNAPGWNGRVPLVG